jgi:c-di-GMP-binding flagellar brake protein YcgR
MTLNWSLSAIDRGWDFGEDKHIMRTAVILQAATTVERRENDRFPVQEDITYRLVTSKPSGMAGTGKTLNFSSGGILFSTRERLPIGRKLEIAVNWPAQLGGRCLLKFVAIGKVVRAEVDYAAVRIERYEFKTRGLVPRHLN